VRVQWRLRGDNSSRSRVGYCLVCLSLLLVCSCMNSDTSTTPNPNQPAAINTNVALVTIDMYDNYYGEADNNLTNPPVWSVAVGADVVATLINHGRRNHNWAIIKQGATIPIPYEEGQGGDILLHGIGMVYSNSQTTVTFSVPEPGEYMVICTVSGHYPEMQGRLVVAAQKDQ
jgi:plastocyanin